MHIGLFGGTFNPIHSCHLSIAEQVLEICNLDQITFIPTGDPPHKERTSLAPAHHRLAMVQMAIDTHPSFQVSEIEIQSSEVSYTIDTVTRLQETSPKVTQWSFIIGLDAFLEFSTWKKADHLLERCHFIVCSRPDAEFMKLPEVTHLPPIPQQALEDLEHGLIHRFDLALSSSKILTLLSLPPCEASASLIRQNRQQGQSISRWLPPSIESYIIQHGLFAKEDT